VKPVVTYQQATKMSVVWQAVSHTDDHSLIIDAEVDCTGYMDFNATLTRKANGAAAAAAAAATTAGSTAGSTATTGAAAALVAAASQTAVNLSVPNAARNAHFAMGLGRKGGFLPSFLSDAPSGSKLCSWIVYDFGRVPAPVNISV
jgi:hypothetical protein